ncbi:MAG: dipeptide ABC transporter ATP-binding protein [Deltaproteobacteria bacterium]|nr:dipeptide ABC transporter ATP-binding protein [Deltaproteobacteria bacterium]
MSELQPVLTVKDLKVHFKKSPGYFKPVERVKAVDGVSLELRPGETMGLVGESGCGKSSLGRAIIRLIHPTEGTIDIGGTNFLALKGGALRRARPSIQMVFQDPYASLDPRMTIQEVLAEPLNAHLRLSSEEKNRRIQKIISAVGIPKTAVHKYPHEFSGGQRQRIAIARALILEPKVLIADEPVSSLDVSVQAQILNLMKDLQREMNLAMLFISHNLAVVRYISHRLAVMYLGKIVEAGESREIYKNPLHPYTRALISAVPIPDPKLERSRTRIVLTGEIPSPVNPPSGCTFHTRCPYAVEKCRTTPPELLSFNGSPQLVRCPEIGRIPRQ